MKIYAVKNRANIIKTLVDLWEKSVRATHDFLTDGEINEIKRFVPTALNSVENLAVVEENETIVAFTGVEKQKIEMLFGSPRYRGRGIGKKLVEYAVKNFSARTVTVNEQNPQAIGFYERLGFFVYERTERDEQGNPYPILYMKIKE